MDGRAAEYQDWAFIMRSCPGYAHETYGEALRIIDTMWKERAVCLVTMNEKHARLSSMLHHMLSMTTKAKALRIVDRIPAGFRDSAW